MNPLIAIIQAWRDRPLRGDLQAGRALAAGLAKELNGTTVYLDPNTLNTLYPETPFYEDQVNQYLEDHRPAITMVSLDAVGQGLELNTEDTFSISLSCENLARTYARSAGYKNEIVPHNLTPELFHSEGKKLIDAYPEIRHPLIAVMTTDLDDMHELADELYQRCCEMPEATIFVCTGPRTQGSSYKELAEVYCKRLNATGSQQNINFITYDLNEENLSPPPKPNPYAGLIDQADHIVVAGISMSTISEVLAAGKTPHLYESRSDEKKCGILQRLGLVKFIDPKNPKGFETENIEPINLTQTILNGIAAHFRRYRDEPDQEKKIRIMMDHNPCP